MITVEIEGLEMLIKSVDDLSKIDFTDEMRDIGLILVHDAKELCPVDSGNLRRSITLGELDKKSVEVGTNCEYAPYVEFGLGDTRNEGVQVRRAVRGVDSGTAFLRPALHTNKIYIQKKLADKYRRTWNK